MRCIVYTSAILAALLLSSSAQGQQLRRVRITPTTDAAGDATVYSDTKISGRIIAVRYTKAGSGNFDDGVDFTVTGETTGLAVWAGTDVNATATVYPRHQVAGPTGTGLTYNGTSTVNEPAAIAGERIKVIVAQGGNTKTGTLDFIVEGGG